MQWNKMNETINVPVCVCAYMYIRQRKLCVFIHHSLLLLTETYYMYILKWIDSFSIHSCWLCARASSHAWTEAHNDKIFPEFFFKSLSLNCCHYTYAIIFWCKLIYISRETKKKKICALLFNHKLVCLLLVLPFRSFDCILCLL